MASADRSSVHVICKRASKTLSRAIYVAYHAGDLELADDLAAIREEVYRVVNSTVPAALPPAASPRDCA